jgi:hypothetical protein
MFQYSAPGGRSYITIRDSNPDTDRRFHVAVSEGFCIGADGLRELASELNAFAADVSPLPEPETVVVPEPETVVVPAKPSARAKTASGDVKGGA